MKKIATLTLILFAATSLLASAEITANNASHQNEVLVVTKADSANAVLNLNQPYCAQYDYDLIICLKNETIVFSNNDVVHLDTTLSNKLEGNPVVFKWVANSKWRLCNIWQNSIKFTYANSISNYTYLSQIKQCTTVG